MRRLIRCALAGALLAGAGCAARQDDWIASTLVTVDVTGEWRGFVAGGFVGGGSHNFILVLTQRGPSVKGRMVGVGVMGSFTHDIDGKIEGDLFRFTGTAALQGEATVAGDEMTGEVSSSSFSRSRLFMQRSTSSTPTQVP